MKNIIKLIKSITRSCLLFASNTLKLKIRKSPSQEENPSLFLNKTSNKNTLTHISAFNFGNAGDTLLPFSVRDLWSQVNTTIKWKHVHVHTAVDSKVIHKINKSKGILIGGGGLFLKDTNANKISGWQWPCSIDMLNEIKVPLVLFSVGYNRFRGQEDFDKCFTENLKVVAEKALFIGLRNHGSINRIKAYLPDKLHEKVVFQPCTTTFLAKLYPTLMKPKQDFIAINMAFDRSNLRFGESIGDILNNIAKSIKKVSHQYPIKFYSHMRTDEAFLPFLDSYGVAYEVVQLYNCQPKTIIEHYSKPRLVIGMRGHAQMIPFGCVTPIVSIITHDKLQWFLDDVEKPLWGADVLSDTFQEDLDARIAAALNNFDEEVLHINKKQDEFYMISQENAENALKAMLQ